MPVVRDFNLVGLGRLELPTSPLSGVRSSHLSYRPGLINWWSWSGSNRRPPECKSGALPAELQPLCLSLRLAEKRGLIHLKKIIEADWTRPSPASGNSLKHHQLFKWRNPERTPCLSLRLAEKRGLIHPNQVPWTGKAATY